MDEKFIILLIREPERDLLDAVDVAADDCVVPDGGPSLHDHLADCKRLKNRGIAY